jgi:hypothetical protein
MGWEDEDILWLKSLNVLGAWITLVQSGTKKTQDNLNTESLTLK